jgi:ribosome-associated heat shock protein Hsp15
MQLQAAPDVRLDKWLWAARVFKTRSQAIAACQAGHVKVAGQRVKPARAVRVGETLTVELGEITRTLRVAGLVERRVGPKLLPQYLEDLTPPSEYARAREQRQEPFLRRPKGLGRPTKKERRLLQLLGFAEPGS